MLRQAAHAGKFYPSSKAVLSRALDEYLKSEISPKPVIAVVVPHAGYVYSGAVAGEVFCRVRVPDTVVLLGPNHTGLGLPFSLAAEGQWETPLGRVNIDEEFAKKWLARSSLLAADASAHEYEHSLEVEVPFLQILNPNVQIVPVVIGTQHESSLKILGEELADILKGRDVLILVSTDMTHYEPHQKAKDKDARTIKAIENLDERELSRVHKDYKISMCGYAPAYAMIVAAKILGATKGELVRYRTSGDVSGDFNSVVGYAGMIVV